MKTYIHSLPNAKRNDIQLLHERILKVSLNGKLWYVDGKDDTGKIVANPSIGYGSQTMKYADGSGREFYQIGISANTAGISVYIIGIADNMYLIRNYGYRMGKASVTGYCIKFRALKDINLDLLEEAIKDGMKQTA